MNLKDSIQNILNKINVSSDKELAVLFTTYINQYEIKEFIPIKVISGKYDESKKLFMSDDGKTYYHMIDVMEGEGYMYRASIDIYRKKYPNMPDVLIKKLFLLGIRKLRFNLAISKDEIPLIMFARIGTNDVGKAVLDSDLLAFYEMYYPNFYNKIMQMVRGDEVDEKTINGVQEEVEFSMEPINIPELYNEVTSNVIDQDEAVKKILTAIWKQYNNFDENKSRNILINGNTGVGKTEIFRILTKRLQIPCAIVNATEYTAEGYLGKSVKDMLLILLRKANGNVKMAENGILIIDEIDKLAQTNSFSTQINQKDVQEALLKLLEDGTYYLEYNDENGIRKVEFNTKKLMIIGMGSFSRIKLTADKTVGFEAKSVAKKYKDITREDMIQNGMLPELIGRFPIVVQMNELTQESFIKILNNPKNSTLTRNKKFFDAQGIKLSLSEDTIKKIAEKAEKQKLGARALDEIVETSLSAVSFEIANNPDMYEEVIITPETIEDNKKYILRKKLKQDEKK